MPEKFIPPAENVCNQNVREAVCIDTARVYDSCADKDCLSDLRVYFTDAAQSVIESAINIRCAGTQVLNVYTDVEEVPFNRGYYSVDITFFFAVTLDVFTSGTAQPVTITGLSVFSKKCILYGSQGSVKVFSSDENINSNSLPGASTNPRAKVQVATPICLDARLCRPCECCNNIQDAGSSIPRCVARAFQGSFGPQSNSRAVRVTIGLFSIVQLERDVQMLIPAYDFCMPTKECSCNTEDPCDSFRRIRFPVSEFFPPDTPDSDSSCGCGCGCKNDSEDDCDSPPVFNPPCCR